MPRATPLQVSFNAGEFSARMEARVDFSKYRNACKRLENFIALPQGGAQRRAGLRFVAEVKDSAKKARPIPFEFSVVQAYIIVAGDLNFRFYKDKGVITVAATDAAITNGTFDSDILGWDDRSTGTGSISWNSAGYMNLNGAGAANVGWAEQDITTTNTGQAHVLKFRVIGAAGDKIKLRVGTTSTGGELVNDVEFAAGYHCYTFTPTASPFFVQFRNENNKTLGIDDVALIAGAPVEIDGSYLEADLSELQFAQTADIMYLVNPDHPVQKLSRSGHTSWSLTEADFIDGPYLVANTDTAKTLTPSAIMGNGITITAAGQSLFASTDVGRLVRIDEGANYGYARIVGFTSATQVTADVKKDFVSATAQSKWRLGAWSGTTGYPSCVAFYEQRLYLAGSSEKPQTLWGSKSAVLEDFTPGTADDDPVNYTIAADRVNVIEWLSPGRQLAVGTAGGEWTVQASSLDDPITPSNVQIKRQTTHGSASIMPKRVGHAVLFLQRSRREIREFAFNFELDSFSAPDLTILADHVSRAATVATSGFTDMDYSQVPDSILWCVRADGVLAALTYQRAEDVIGWARHITGDPNDRDDGAFEGVAVIPGVQEDEVWVVVKRVVGGQTKRYIEFFETRDFENQNDAFSVDSGLSLNKWNTDTAKTLTLTGGGPWATGDATSMTSSGHTPFLSGDVGQIWSLGRGRDQVAVEITAFASASDVGVKFLGAVPASLRAIATSDWLDPDDKVTTVAGLDHLEGKEVDILADGAVHPSKTVSAGSVTLESAAGKIHAGLKYSSVIETLKVAAGAARGTAVGQLKRIDGVSVVLLDSIGMKIGPDEATLDVVPFRSTADPMDAAVPLFTGEKFVSFPGDVDTDTRIVIEQTQPLPLMVLGAAVHLKVEER